MTFVTTCSYGLAVITLHWRQSRAEAAVLTAMRKPRGRLRSPIPRLLALAYPSGGPEPADEGEATSCVQNRITSISPTGIALGLLSLVCWLTETQKRVGLAWPLTGRGREGNCKAGQSRSTIEGVTIEKAVNWIRLYSWQGGEEGRIARLIE